jgi:hypothetical protein
MMQSTYQALAVPFTAALFASQLAVCDTVDWYMNRQAWENAVGDYTTIDFTGLENGEPLSNQYADLGVLFSSAGSLFAFNSCIFVNDCWGMRGEGGGGAWVHFDEPMNWIAADHPGSLSFALYFDDELIIEIGAFGGSGTGHFAGLVSEKPFNKARLFRAPPALDFVYIDDLHFGAIAVPAPGALGVLAVALLVHRRRRRW